MVRRRETCVTLLLLLLLTACDSILQPSDDLPITRLTQTGFGGFDAPQRVVVRSTADWEEVWRALWRRVNEAPPLPSINFSEHMVVVAAAGTKPTSGYSITVESASASRDRATITVRSVSPGNNCAVLQVLTSPIDVVRMPRRDEVTFVEVSEIRSC